MKKVMVRSVHDAFDYVMSHYYPFGCEAYAERTDSYAIISIQDTHTDGFGFRFCEGNGCTGVLTLLFDDVWKETEGLVSFSEDMARQVIRFIREQKDADTLIVHCYAGQSRSRAVGAFAVKMLGGDNSRYFTTGSPNMLAYNMLEKVYREMQSEAAAPGGQELSDCRDCMK